MKVSKEHLKVLADAIKPLDTEERRLRYANFDIPRADFVKDINKRYRWDLFWAASGQNQTDLFAILTRDYKDAHIDTALKSIVPSLPELGSARIV